MPIDDRNVISKKASKQLAHLAKNEQTLNMLYNQFVSKEEHCTRAILECLDRYARNIVHNTVVSPPDIAQDGPLDINDFIANLMKGSKNKDQYSNIDKSLYVAEVFTTILSILQAVFSLGNQYGKAIYEHNLFPQEETVAKPLVTNEEAIRIIEEALGNTDFNLLFNGGQIVENTDEYEEDRGPAREEDSDDPEGN